MDSSTSKRHGPPLLRHRRSPLRSQPPWSSSLASSYAWPSPRTQAPPDRPPDLVLLAQPTKEVVLGRGRMCGVLDAHKALATHEGAEQLLPHAQEEDVLALAGMGGQRGGGFVLRPALHTRIVVTQELHIADAEDAATRFEFLAPDAHDDLLIVRR